MRPLRETHCVYQVGFELPKTHFKTQKIMQCPPFMPGDVWAEGEIVWGPEIQTPAASNRWKYARCLWSEVTDQKENWSPITQNRESNTILYQASSRSQHLHPKEHVRWRETGGDFGVESPNVVRLRWILSVGLNMRVVTPLVTLCLQRQFYITVHRSSKISITKYQWNSLMVGAHYNTGSCY
jgi:hypothetical protein